MPDQTWTSDDLTTTATYLPQFNAVKYTYPDDDDGVPCFRAVLLDRETVATVLGLFPEADHA